jgi:2'-5' RNA ligase
VAAGISECEQLAAAIRSGPLERELHYPYHPHVTVAHDVPEPALDAVFAELAGFEAQFPVDSFTLYEHGDDGHWHPQRTYALTGPPRG